MHLKSITMQGFKTFAPKTTIELRPGITAVVGPNGSGKSNIADAVRWALGESNLRHVRCKTTDELIFAGTARRASVGVAEVSLIFANEGGWLDLPFQEVRVTRRAYRSGENEYLLNGSRVRLRDIVDLLAGASIHAGGHVVVGQGLVDAVLALRAEDRRPLIENLAGLKQYYLRRDEADSRLGATETNLTQVDTMIAELAPRLATLTAQAEALAAYRAAESELRSLQRATYGAQAARLRQRAELAGDTAAAARAALTASRAELEALRSTEEALLDALARDRALRDDLRMQAGTAERALAAARGDRDVAEAQAAAASERAHFGQDEYARVARALTAARAAALQAETNVAELAAAVSAADEALRDRRLDAERLAAEHQDALAARRRARHAHDACSGALSRSAQSRAIALSSSERLQQDIDHHAATEVAVCKDRDGAAAALAARGATLSAANGTLEGARADAQAAKSALGLAQRELVAAEAGHQKAVLVADRAEGRREMLAQAVDSAAGMDKHLLALASDYPALGIAGQLLRIDPSWQQAIFTLLGERFHAVVTAEPRAFIDRLEHGSSERVRLVTIGESSDTGLAARALDELCRRAVLQPCEVLGWASEMVEENTTELRQALDLDRTVLVRDPGVLLRCRPYLAETGLTVLAREPAIAAFPDGSLAFGLDERTSAAVARRDELTAAEQQLALACEAEVAARQRLDAARQVTAGARAKHDRAQERVAEAGASASATRDECRFAERVAAQMEQSCTEAGARGARMRGELARLRQGLDADALKDAELREAAETARIAFDRAHSTSIRAEEQLARANDARKDDESALSMLRDRLSTATALLEERRGHAAALERDAQRLGELESTSREAIARLGQLRDAAALRQAQAAEELRVRTARLAPLDSAVLANEESHAALRGSLSLAAAACAATETAYERSRREAEASARELDIMRAQVSAELGCAIEELPAAGAPAGAVGRVKTLRAELAAAGLVNARAEEDARAASERLSFLETQARDLREGVSMLRAIIAEANSTVRERFAATVAGLDEHFGQFFTRLFGGGTCGLVALYDEQGLPTGVEVHAQPPGKRTRDLALLSGGERALIAMALLFAMLRVRPVPFCLLDEVEAALDEANTGRFGAILRELSEGTQFILVTHNRGTMLHANRLYGITMSETGISTAASLELTLAGEPAMPLETASVP